jgi:hypothetical protein
VKLLREVDASPTKNIKMPGDWQKHLDPTVVAEMTRTLEAAAAVHGDLDAYKHSGLPYVILDQGQTLRAGRNRYAASKAAGVPIGTRVFEFNHPDEAEEVELKENLHRKTLSQEQEDRDTRRLVELAKARIERERAAAGEGGSRNSVASSQGAAKPGPKKSAESEAIDEVSKGIGISRQGVQKRLKRAAGEQDPTQQPGPTTPTIKTWGLGGEERQPLFKAAALLQDAMDTVSHTIARAVGAISEVEQIPEVLGWPALLGLKDQLHQLGRVARQLRPEAICPFCKGVVAGCPSCGGRQLVGQGAVERAPAELLLAGDQAMVCVGPGQLVPLKKGKGKTFAAEGQGPERDEGKRQHKKLDIELPDGSKFPPEPAADDDGDIPF